MTAMVLPVEVPVNTVIEALYCLPVLLLWLGPAVLMVMLSLRWVSVAPQDDLRGYT